MGDIQGIDFWWHSFPEHDIDGNSRTETQKMRYSHTPDVSGKTVLDIGCWDGWYSFRAAEDGADVTAVDSLQMEDFVEEKFGVEDYCGSSGFKTMRELKDLRDSVKYFSGDFMEQIDESFDVVMCFGVLYHLKDPLSAIEWLYNHTDETLVLETRVLTDTFDPVMKFANGENDDSTNYWFPSESAVIEMLNYAGFDEVKTVRRYGKRVIIRAETFKA